MGIWAVPVVISILILIFGTNQNAFAVIVNITDQASCEAAGGVFDGINNKCKFAGSLTIPAGDVWTSTIFFAVADLTVEGELNAPNTMDADQLVNRGTVTTNELISIGPNNSWLNDCDGTINLLTNGFINFDAFGTNHGTINGDATNSITTPLAANTLDNSGTMDPNIVLNKVSLQPVSSPCTQDADIETDFPFQVVCNTTGQLCEPLFSVNVETQSELLVKYTVTGHCSSVRVHVFLDGNPVTTSEFLGWVLSPPPPPFDELPLMTPIIDLGPVSPGTHQVSLQGEGQVSGCNSGALGVWDGTLTTFTNEQSESDIHEDILTEVQNIEEKLDGDRSSFITQIVDTLTSIVTDIGTVLGILQDENSGIGAIKSDTEMIKSDIEMLKGQLSILDKKLDILLKDDYSEETCEDLQEKADMIIANGKKIPLNLKKRLALCNELFP